MIRRKYLSDYETDPLAGRFSSGAVYVGKKFYFLSPESERKKAKISIFIFSFISLACLIAAECMPSKASSEWYAIIPYVISVIISAFCFRNALMTLGMGEWITRKEYDTYIKPGKVPALLSSAFCLISAAASLFPGFDDRRDVFRFVLIIISSAASVPSVLQMKHLACSAKDS